MKNNVRWSGSVMIGMLALAACGGKQAQQGPPQAQAVPVTVADVTTTDAVYYDEYPGTVTALNQIDLRPQVTGYITGIFFKDGDRVSKGQKLYTIDEQVYNANYQNAVANVAVQEANLVKAQKDAARYHELDKNDAIAKQQVDNADAALAAAQKQVEAAKANVRAVQANVRFSTVYAPFDGTIGISQVKVGASVAAGTSVLNTVSTDNPIAVDFVIDQKELYRFLKLEQKGANAKDSTFTIAFNGEAYPYAGHISLIDRAVDPQTGTIKIRLVFNNDKKLLKAGMNTTVRVRNDASVKSTVIPFKAVTEQLGEFFVYVVGDSSKVSQQKVALGKQLGTTVVIKSGLKEGEKIVVQGVQNLRQGAVITVAQPGQQPGGAPAQKK